MTPEALTEDSLIHFLLDPQDRDALLNHMKHEIGTHLHLRNRYFEVALKCKATATQVEKVVAALIESCEAPEEYISPFIFHSLIPQDVLFYLLDRNICISDLGHRNGPRRLLERLAEEHAHSEAITTLMLDYYGTDENDDADFLAFITKYRNDPMLLWNLHNNPTLPEKKRRLALGLIDNLKE